MKIIDLKKTNRNNNNKTIRLKNKKNKKKKIPCIYDITDNDIYLCKKKVIINSNNTEVQLATKSPMGFANTSDSTINIDLDTKKFIISPVSDSYDVWVCGTKFIVDTTKYISMDIDPSDITMGSGIYYIAYQKDINNNLELVGQRQYFYFEKQAPIAYLYYNASDPSGYLFFDSRFGITMDYETRKYLIFGRASQIKHGFIITNYTSGSTVNSNLRFGFKFIDLSSTIIGTIINSDFEYNILNILQTLNPYMTDVTIYNLINGQLKRTVNTNGIPFVYDISNIPQYNDLTSGGSMISITTSGYYFSQWVVATNNYNAPIIILSGYNQFSSTSNIPGLVQEWQFLMTNYASSISDFMDFSYFVANFRPCYRLIYQYSTTLYTLNSYKTALFSIVDTRNFDQRLIGIN